MEYQSKSTLVPAICTQCNGQLQVDPDKDAAICPYCGTAFVVAKAINYYQQQQISIDKSVVGHADNVTINSGPNGNLATAFYYTDKILDRRIRLKIEKERIKMEKMRQQAEKEARDLENFRKWLPMYLIMAASMVGLIFVALHVLKVFAKF